MIVTRYRIVLAIVLTVTGVAACTDSHTSVASPLANPGARPGLGEVVLDHGPTAPASVQALARVAPMLRAAYAEAQAFGDVNDAVRSRINLWEDSRDRWMVDVVVRADLPHQQGLLPSARALGMNVTVVQHGTGIFMGSTPLHRLPDLAALPGVQRVEVARPMTKHLDRSIPSSSPVNSMNLTRGGHDGSGTVVGVVDTGIDYTHQDFIDELGNSRIAYIWDQTDCANVDPPTGGSTGTYGCNDTTSCGSEYTRAQIDCMLDPTGVGCGSLDPVGQQDIDAHGTHVASTAAGDGDATSGAPEGVAPGADIIMVKFDFDQVCNRNSTIAINEGVRYIFERAAAMGMPAAVNLSLGSDLGPHNGLEGGDVALSALTGPGNIVVAAAGNAARNAHPANLSVFGHPIHGSGTIVEGATTSFTFDIPSGYTEAAYGDNYVLFDVWFSQGAIATADVTVRTPSGRRYTINAGQDACKANGRNGRICVFNSGADPYWEIAGADNEIWIQIDDGNFFVPQAGTYTVELTGLSIPGGTTTYHSWMATGRYLGETLASYPSGPADNDLTVGSPAVADDVLAVAAYTTRDTWTDMNGVSQGYGQAGSQVEYYGPMPVDELAFFSSRGGRRGDTVLKPEIASPGAGIVAAFSHWTYQDEAATAAGGGSTYFYPGRITDSGAGGTNAYAVLQGTSMATPHATGGVALLLAADPTLTPQDVRDVWARTSVDEGDAGDDHDWGMGRFDLDAALADVATAECTVDADCDDADFCTADSCDGSGSCVNTVMTCDDGDACTSDFCDAGTGLCAFDPIICDDGDACNGAESCDAMLGCQSGTPVDCSDANACTSDVCNPSDGSCSNPALTCSDGDACTADSCDTSMGCVYTPISGCSACSARSEACDTDGDCCSGLSCRGRKCR